ncbi:MAG: isoprenylcysteine carboxylmethyltransferase family protein [Bryobacterales bacterium]|nr:isoprenylcysteine carboxylmethyltransferase family protein [Bryobacterales bacterium]
MTSLQWMAIPWIAFLTPFVWNHLRVRRTRQVESTVERRVGFAPAANLGLLLQALGIGVCVATASADREWLLPWAYALAAISIWISAAALMHLGREWRIQAVVTDDHRLVTTGPYARLRHPVYAALLLMVLATMLVGATGITAAIAAGLYVLGTEIRVRAEESLLRRQFGEAYDEYSRRTSAYLPFLR